jgi:hypothetical protein
LAASIVVRIRLARSTIVLIGLPQIAKPEIGSLSFSSRRATGRRDRARSGMRRSVTEATRGRVIFMSNFYRPANLDRLQLTMRAASEEIARAKVDPPIHRR